MFADELISLIDKLFAFLRDKWLLSKCEQQSLSRFDAQISGLCQTLEIPMRQLSKPKDFGLFGFIQLPYDLDSERRMGVLRTLEWEQAMHGLRETAKYMRQPPTSQVATNEEANDWIEYRDDRSLGGQLLTAKYCKERYNVSGKDLTIAAEKDRSIRRSNPNGRGYVYRWNVVRDIADRKSRED